MLSPHFPCPSYGFPKDSLSARESFDLFFNGPVFSLRIPRCVASLSFGTFGALHGVRPFVRVPAFLRLFFLSFAGLFLGSDLDSPFLVVFSPFGCGGFFLDLLRFPDANLLSILSRLLLIRDVSTIAPSTQGRSTSSGLFCSSSRFVFLFSTENPSPCC